MVTNTWAPTQPATNANYGASTVPSGSRCRPIPQFGNGDYGSGNGINMNGDPGGDSEYNSLQTKAEKRMTHHFHHPGLLHLGQADDRRFRARRWASSAITPGRRRNWKNLNLEHSLSPQDVKFQFNWQVSYDLPIGQGRAINLHGPANEILGDWTVNTIVYRSTGVPVAAPVGTGDPYFLQRVNQNCDPGVGAPHTPDEWFNWTCFSTPVDPLRPGTAHAYLSSVRTAGAHDLDLSLYKNFHLWKEANVRFEASAYNLTNSVQFGYPSVFWYPTANAADMAGFGQITGDVNTPRQLQFGTKFTF